MPLVLYNSLTRRKEPFEPLDPELVRLYVCGPTVYDLAHIGNGRAVVVFDQLYRLLRHAYGADHVRYVRNITDIDDKIIAAARDNGETIEELTRRTIALFQADMAALGALPPDVEPRCTGHVPQMVFAHSMSGTAAPVVPSGKNSSGSQSRHAARACQSGLVHVVRRATDPPRGSRPVGSSAPKASPPRSMTSVKRQQMPP